MPWNDDKVIIVNVKHRNEENCQVRGEEVTKYILLLTSASWTILWFTQALLIVRSHYVHKWVQIVHAKKTLLDVLKPWVLSIIQRQCNLWETAFIQDTRYISKFSPDNEQWIITWSFERETPLNNKNVRMTTVQQSSSKRWLIISD